MYHSTRFHLNRLKDIVGSTATSEGMHVTRQGCMKPHKASGARLELSQGSLGMG